MSPYAQPLISILIPCYNAGPWIAESIQSALGQTYPNKEVIVVDDGSQDDSLAIIQSFAGRIRFETGPNRGGNVARNRLIQLSKGSWLSFLDADDYLLPEKVERQVAFVAKQPETDVLYAPAIEFHEDVSKQRTHVVEDEDLYANYFRWALFSTNSLFLRKAAVEEAGGWNEEQRVCQEHELILRLILKEKRFALFPEALVVNRLQSTASVSRRSPINTLAKKMELSARLEAHLLSRGEMSDLRARALAQARYRGARTAYPWDPVFARALAGKASAKIPITQCPGLNKIYRWAFRLFGLDFAERLAAIRRGLVGVSRL